MDLLDISVDLISQRCSLKIEISLEVLALNERIQIKKINMRRQPVRGKKLKPAEAKMALIARMSQPSHRLCNLIKICGLQINKA